MFQLQTSPSPDQEGLSVVLSWQKLQNFYGGKYSSGSNRPLSWCGEDTAIEDKSSFCKMIFKKTHSLLICSWLWYHPAVLHPAMLK